MGTLTWDHRHGVEDAICIGANLLTVETEIVYEFLEPGLNLLKRLIDFYNS